MKKWVAKLILSSTAQDITWSKWYWSGAIQLNAAISNGKGSRFMKFMGKKLLGLKAIAKKIGIKVKGKAGLKVKGKAGLKIKGKKPKAGLKLKVKAKKPSLKVKAKVGGKAKLSVTKPKAKVSLKVKAKKA